MTVKRNLKRRVRDRQARTGESYVTARRHVLAARPAVESDETTEAADPAETREPVAPESRPLSVTELLDVPADAQRLGFRCRVLMIQDLAERAAPSIILASLRDVLIGGSRGLDTARLFGVAFGVPTPPAPTRDVFGGLELMRRARAGLSGTTDDGRMLAWHVAAPGGIVRVLCTLWDHRRPMPPPGAIPPADPEFSLFLASIYDRETDFDLTVRAMEPSARELAHMAVLPALLAPLVSPSTGLAPGDRVLVTGGPFAGQEAVVETLDYPAGAVDVTIELADKPTQIRLRFREVAPWPRTLHAILDGQHYWVSKPNFVIGRGWTTCDLVIRDSQVSRAHAAVILRHGRHYLKDLGSAAGTIYKGMRIDNKRIDEGDEFDIGGRVVRFTYLIEP